MRSDEWRVSTGKWRRGVIARSGWWPGAFVDRPSCTHVVGCSGSRRGGLEYTSALIAGSEQPTALSRDAEVSSRRMTISGRLERGRLLVKFTHRLIVHPRQN